MHLSKLCTELISRYSVSNEKQIGTGIVLHLSEVYLSVMYHTLYSPLYSLFYLCVTWLCLALSLQNKLPLPVLDCEQN